MSEPPVSRGPAASDAGLTRSLLTGWGRTAATAARVLRPSTVEQVRDALQMVRAGGPAPSRGVAVRGLGRSYGDAAQSAGGTVVDLTGLDAVRDLQVREGDALLTCAAGASLHDLLRLLVPQGWFVPVTPGTRYVTVGGAIAADVHGKNHHRDGSFASHVESLSLLDGRGEAHLIGPQSDPEAFWATAGGMGLTGVIVEATLRLLPVQSSWMLVDTERAANLDDLLDRLSSRDHLYRYSVACIDCLATGRSAGRGVITRGEHAPADALHGRATARAWAVPSGPLVSLPGPLPAGLLNRASVAAFNEAWFRKAPRHRAGELQPFPRFFHPLDGVGDWNAVYGRRGFLQYQFVVPIQREDTLREVLARLRGARVPSFLAVLKRFGPADPGPLSFPRPGWTLALDIPAGLPGLAGLLDECDLLVAEAGGAVYLAKDSRMRPELLSMMYPRLEEWKATRDRLDPDRIFRTDLSRRLNL